ncbi:MAG TPA: cation-translocating P-type ATPase [Aggregatilineales bacterium]|nr:cation-translocating P-type ATPase [Aggregatilineales bacterium]
MPQTDKKQAAEVEFANWHMLDADAAAQRLGVDPVRGLTAADAQKRLEKYGPNVLTDSGGVSFWKVLGEQLTDPMVLILLGAALISIFLGKVVEVIAILAIVVLNASIGVSQEMRAERAMAALKKMAAPSVRLRRDGVEMEIPSDQVVPGDIVLLEAGNIVPADGRIVETANLSVMEASLTGESVAVEKSIHTLDSPDMTIGDRTNMVYLGTAVTYGRGVVLVTGTGMNTQLGRIASLIQNVEETQTPLQRRMSQLGKILLWVAIGIVVLATLIGFANVDWSNAELVDVTDVFVGAVAIAVAVVPEGLPAVVTIALALGAQRMLRRRALIRKLPAVETLGSVTVICSDKTGTLTQNIMTVKIVDIADLTQHIETMELNRDRDRIFSREYNYRKPISNAQAMLLTDAAISNDAMIGYSPENPQELSVFGDPTEAALMIAAAYYGLRKTDLVETLPRVAEVPFDSDRKRMTTVHAVHAAPSIMMEESTEPVTFFPKHADGSFPSYIAFTKGAVDSLLDSCTAVMTNGKTVPLTPELRQRILASNDQFAAEGLRVLGMAFRTFDALPETVKVDTVEQNLIFTGMMGMIDPPRPEVKEAVRQCVAAGIRPVMITGDHPLTAFAIAKELKIVGEDDDYRGRVITGKELARMSVEDLERVVDSVPVYARVSPEHKLNIVRALQRRGNVVAMTGDGVNDAPALKQSDIGVAMGITGTAVSKEASDMVILDDNFASIVSAVEEGRTIFDNVRKFVRYILGSNVGEVGVLFATQLIGLQLPLNTLQVLWMNLVTDGLPALALSVEKGESDRMLRPPYSPNESLFSRGLGWYLLRVGFIIFLIGMAMVLFFPIERVDGSALTIWQALDMGNRGMDVPEATEFGSNVWSTMIFTTLVFSQMGHALAVRSERRSLFEIGIFSNRAALIAIGTTVLLQLALIYLPLGASIFGTAPLTLGQLLACFAVGLVTFFYVEIDKLFFARRQLRKYMLKAPAAA